MPTWTVTVDYDGLLPASEQDALDAAIDRLAEKAGELMDSGSGAGFNRRHLDYSFESEAAALCLAEAVERGFGNRPDADLSVRVADMHEATDS